MSMPNMTLGFLVGGKCEEMVTLTKEFVFRRCRLLADDSIPGGVNKTFVFPEVCLEGDPAGDVEGVEESEGSDFEEGWPPLLLFAGWTLA